jgi:hypothetical protein
MDPDDIPLAEIRRPETAASRPGRSRAGRDVEPGHDVEQGATNDGSAQPRPMPRWRSRLNHSISLVREHPGKAVTGGLMLGLVAVAEWSGIKYNHKKAELGQNGHTPQVTPPLPGTAPPAPTLLTTATTPLGTESSVLSASQQTQQPDHNPYFDIAVPATPSPGQRVTGEVLQRRADVQKERGRANVQAELERNSSQNGMDGFGLD